MEIPSEKTHTKKLAGFAQPILCNSQYSNAEMEPVFSQMNVVKLELRNGMSAELVNAILNSRAGLKRDNIIKYVMNMAEISESVTMRSFIGTCLVYNASNTAEGCDNLDNWNYFCRNKISICILS